MLTWYTTFTDDSEGGCLKEAPELALSSQEAEEANQLNTRLVETKKRTVFNIFKLPNKRKSVSILY